MPRRAIVVVTEGASPALVQEWCAKGRLPGFAHLFGAGASGPLDSNSVPYEPPGLTAALTGHGPGEHGWFSYWTAHAPDYMPRPFTSADVHVPFVWQRQELAARQFGVINVFGTHPPVPLNGYLVSYPPVQSLRTCYPPGLLLELSRKALMVSHDVSVWFSGQARTGFVDEVLKADERRGRIALEFWARGVDAVVVNLTGIDRLSHCYWQELEPGSRVPLDDSAVFRAYRSSDLVLQQLIEAMDEETSLLAFSEIGFGPVRSYVSINRHLAASGLLTWEDAAAGRIRWPQTLAFEAVQGTHGVNINVAGRYRDGTVQPAEYERCRDRVVETLLGQINPHTGLPFARAVSRREEVYAGAARDQAPDLIVEPFDDRYLPFGDPYWAQHVMRSLHSGWHRRGSYWAGVGAAFASGAEGTTRQLVDVAPTIFHMLGEARPTDLSGTPLGGARNVAPAARSRTPVASLA